MKPVKPVLLIRPGNRNSEDANALAARGIPTVIDPYLDITVTDDRDATVRVSNLLAAIHHDADWLLVTSANAIWALTELTSQHALRDALHFGVRRGLRVAAVGDASANALHAIASLTVHCPSQATAQSLASLLLTFTSKASAVIPLSAQALPTLTDRLTRGGWHVTGTTVYQTSTVTQPPESVAAIAQGAFSAIVVRSPTAVRALHQYSPSLPNGTMLVCGGPTTQAEAARLYGVPLVTSTGADPQTIADTVAQALAVATDC